MSALKPLTLAVLMVCFFALGSLRGESLEVVEFRLIEWKSLHFAEARQAKQYYEIFHGIGCECKQDAHGDHIDVAFRCPKWRSLSLKSHSEAHKWEAFLQQAGFETKHKH